jgi:hypothetical protein
MRYCLRLWAHQISKHGATKVTSFELVFGQEVVLPIEVNLQACRVARQNDLSAKEYTDLMIDKLERSTGGPIPSYDRD